MATTPKQRKGATQLGILAGMTGGAADPDAQDLRAKLGPLSEIDVVNLKALYREGFRSAKNGINEPQNGPK